MERKWLTVLITGWLQILIMTGDLTALLLTHHRVSSHPGLHTDHVSLCPHTWGCVTEIVTDWTDGTDTTGHLEYFDINC